MADPVGGAIVSAIVSGTVNQVWGQIMNTDNPEATWMRSAETCVVEARSSIKNYDAKLGENYERMKRKIGNIGDSAQQLAERGKIEDFADDLIEHLEELARACIKYANSPTVNNYEFEEEFVNELDDISERITNIT